MKIPFTCRILALTLVLIAGIHFSYAQSTGIQWKKRFGGNGNEVIKRIVQVSALPNEHFLVFGNSSSTNEMPTAGGTDVWISRWTGKGERVWSKYIGNSGGDDFTDLVYDPNNSSGPDSTSHGASYITFSALFSGIATQEIGVSKILNNGTVSWKNTFGGFGSDVPVKIIKVQDGLVIAGNSTSTELTGHHGGTDLYVLKINNNGILQWQRCLGGSGSDESKSVTADSEGNIYVTGITNSADGDVSVAKGGSDFWVVKLNASGNTIWEKSFGGGRNDVSTDIKLLPDGNLIVAGSTTSFDGDVTGYHFSQNASDAWMIKMDTSGAVIWRRCYGGTGAEGVREFLVNPDGTIYFSSSTNSGDGDVTGFHGLGLLDVWVVKLSATGDIIWQKSVGGTNSETFTYTGESTSSITNFRRSINADPDGGCIVAVHTNSTDGDVTGFRGPPSGQDVWIFKMSSTGSLMWQKCIGGTTGKDFVGDYIPTTNGNYLAAIYSTSVDGDLDGSFGGQDGLLVKLGAVNHIKGVAYVDFNNNNIKDEAETLYPYPLTILTAKASDSTRIITENGTFDFEADTGNFVTSVAALPAYITASPVSKASAFTSYFGTDSFSFAIKPISGFKDVFVKVIPLTRVRAGFPADYLIFYGNIGTDTLYNVNLSFNINAVADINSTVPAADNQTGNVLQWSLPQLNPFESFKSITVHVTAKPTTRNDIAQTLSSISFTGTDQSPENNFDTSKIVIVGSFDPNDKMELHGGVLTQEQAANRDYLDYVIRFQNTGTDTAFTVIVKDTLLSRIDPSSVVMVHASHPYTMMISPDNIITWTFNNINLPDSNVNEPLSHGYITFRARPIAGLFAGDTVHNYASIYFDFNEPVQTLDGFAVVESIALPVHLISFTGTYSNQRAMLTWTTTNEDKLDRYEIERSENGASYSRTGVIKAVGETPIHQYDYTENLSTVTAEKIFYRLKIVDIDGGYSYSPVVILTKENTAAAHLIYPNPAKNRVYIKGLQKTTQVQVIDINGRILLQRKYNPQGLVRVDLPALPGGIYFFKLSSDGQTTITKLVIR